MKTLNPGLVCESDLVRNCIGPCGELLRRTMEENADYLDSDDSLEGHMEFCESTLDTFDDFERDTDEVDDELCDDIFSCLDWFVPAGYYFGLNKAKQVGVWPLD